MNRPAAGFALLAVLVVASGAGAAVLVSDPTAERPPEVSSPPDVAQVFGAFDGDGRPDRMTLFRDALEWKVRAELTTGSVSETRVDAHPAVPEFLGVADVNSDGIDEVWIDTRTGNTQRVGALIAFAAGHPRVVTDPAGRRAVFTWAAGSNCCVGATLDVVCADVDGEPGVLSVVVEPRGDTGVFEWRRQVYRLVGTVLHPIREETGTYVGTTDDPLLPRVNGLICGSTSHLGATGTSASSVRSAPAERMGSV